MAVVKALSSRVSYADLEKWPDDGRRYELYDGEVYEVPSPIPLHQMVSARLHLALDGYTRAHGGIVLYAPLDIVLTDYDVVQPDLLLFTRDRVHVINPTAVTRQAPDLAIEILSPTTSANDRGRKMRLLARHGVRELWLVDPDAAAIEIYQLAGHDFVLAARAGRSDTVASTLLPGFTLTPRDVVSFE